MLWMLVIYVVAANGYAGPPVITSSFHGATYATKDECATAAKTVGLYPSVPDDIAKVGLVAVCAPVSPAPPAQQQASADPAQAENPFPAYAPPPRKKK